MTLDELQRRAWAGAEAKGFHANRSPHGRDDTLVRLGLVVTEVAEAMQVVKRHWNDEGTTELVRHQLADELADVLIRVGDLAGCLNLDLAEAVEAKMEVNSRRPRLYGTPDEDRSGERRGGERTVTGADA